MDRITQAFVLGAGMGLRLRPMTEQTPKPLVPIFGKPLITFSLDHLRSVAPRPVHRRLLPGAFPNQEV